MPTDKKPTTVKAYLASLPPERREAIEAVRKVILKNLDKGYEEGIQYGMIGYFVPHSVYEPGYHCDAKQPVPFVSLASQKNHMAAYLFCLYCDPDAMAAFEETWNASGKKLDMGKSCVRFKNLDGVCLEAIGQAIKAMPAKKFIEAYEAGLAEPKKRPTKKVGRAVASKAAADRAKKAAATKTAKKAVTKKKVTKKPAAKKTTTKKTTKKASKKPGR